LYLIVQVRIWQLTVDDAFISFRYAENWARGQGFVYNAGERVEGYTNFLYTALIGLLIKLRADPVLAAKILCIAGGVSALILTERLGHLPFPSKASWRLVAPVLLASNAVFVIHTVDGLETSLSTALVLLVALLSWREFQKPGSVAVSGIVLAAACLTRPDNMLLLPVLLAIAPKAQSEGVHHKAARRRWLISFLLLFSAVFVPYYCWRFWFYGHPLPNTFYAKGGGTWHLIHRGLRSLKLFAAQVTLPVGILAAAALLKLRQRRWLLLWCGIVLVKVGFQLWSGGAWIGRLRFLLPAMPFIYLLAVIGLHDVHRALCLAWREKGRLIAIAHAAVALVLIGTLAANLHNSGPLYAEGEKYAAGIASLHIPLGKRLRERAGRAAILACQDAGALPFYSRLRTIDLFGLNDAHIAHLPAPYLEQVDLDYVLSRRPDYMVLNSWSGTGEPFDGTALVPRLIYADARFKRDYRLAALYHGPLYWNWVFVHAGSPVGPVLLRRARDP
jgi:hypothetical protein